MLIRISVVVLLLALFASAHADGIYSTPVTASNVVTACGASSGQALYDNAGNCAGTPNVTITGANVTNLTGALVNSGASPVGNTGSCSVGITLAGGATVGTWVSTNECPVTGTIILSAMPGVTTGYACDAADRTTAGVVVQETSTTSTAVTFTVRTTATASNDILQFKCSGY